MHGENPELPKHEATPTVPYAASKLAGEAYCGSFTEVHGLLTDAPRYFNVFGPRQDPRSQYSAVTPLFSSSFQNGVAPTVYGDGEKSRDFTHAENAIEANVRAADAGPECVSGQAYNVASGVRISLNELRTLTQTRLAPDCGEPRVRDVRPSQADISRASERLEYEPRIEARDGLWRSFALYEERRGGGHGRTAPA